jgi:hypothetical protein
MDNRLAPLCGAGLALVPIPPINGKPTKAPTGKGWNKPRSTENPGGYSSNAEDFANCQGFNFGLYHGASKTMALDIDDLEQAKDVFEDVADIDLIEWLKDPKRLEIKSSKANRGKLLFRITDGFAGAGLRQFKHNGKTIFELRSGNCQDVIYGQHPEGGEYQLIGNPASIPEAPEVLLDMLAHWDAWKACFESALNVEQEPPKEALRQPQQGAQLPGWRDPIQAFNQSYSVADVLIRNGYQQKGKGRFIRPGSESKAPGVVIMQNCADGTERVYSHGGDCLNNGFAHDAFDCMRLLEHGGDFNKALAWNPEITKHNQRLYMQEQTKSGSESTPRDDYIKGQEDPKEKPLFPLIKASELTAKPTPIIWLLEDIIEQGSLNLLFGQPSSGKSLFALDWAFCIAAGIDWHEHRTKQTDIVIIAGEGYAGMARRLKALEQKYGIPAPERLFISQRPAQLLDTNNAQWVADSIAAICPNPGLVIVDTMHRNMQGDENSSQDIGQFISNLDNFLRPLGAAVLIVHHSGHEDKQRSRGSSSIRAAMDGEFSAAKDKRGDIELTCHKSKDFEAFKPVSFALVSADLGDEWLNDDGEHLTSVYLKYIGNAKADKASRKLTARDDAILTSLVEAIEEHGIEPTAEIKKKYGGFEGWMNKDRKVVHVDHWRDKAYPRIDAETPDAKSKAFKRCRTKLFELGRIVDYDGYWWLIYPPL